MAKACLCLKSWIQNRLLKDKLNIDNSEKKDNNKENETIVIE